MLVEWFTVEEATVIGRIKNSWALVKTSWEVLKQDRELMLFPVISGVTVVLAASTFFGGAFLFGLENVFEDGSVLGVVGGFLFYLVTYTIIIFFQSALVGAALIRLDGGDPTVRDGFSIAYERLGTIIAYAAIAATVGMILRMIQERVGFLGRLFAGFGAIAWTLATYMVVPVLVSRDIDPIEAIKESAGLVKQTWGEQVTANIGFGAVSLLASGVVLIFGVLGMVLTANIAPALIPLIVVSMIGGFLAISLVSSTLSGIYTAALYRFATTGEAPGGFDERFMSGAFAPKK